MKKILSLNKRTVTRCCKFHKKPKVWNRTSLANCVWLLQVSRSWASYSLPVALKRGSCSFQQPSIGACEVQLRCTTYLLYVFAFCSLQQIFGKWKQLIQISLNLGVSITGPLSWHGTFYYRNLAHKTPFKPCFWHPGHRKPIPTHLPCLLDTHPACLIEYPLTYPIT